MLPAIPLIPDSEARWDVTFKSFIKSTLKLTGLNNAHIDCLTDEKGMFEFKKAFTHSSVDPVNNYEFYEFMGDLTLNKFVIFYAVEKIPSIKQSSNMGLAHSIKEHFQQKTYISPLAKQYGFESYIRFTRREGEKEISMRSLLEDTFEAFLYCLESQIDKRIAKYTGWGTVYQFLSNIFTEVEIPTDYSKLKDPISKMKELFENHDVVAAGFRRDTKSVVSLDRNGKKVHTTTITLQLPTGACELVSQVTNRNKKAAETEAHTEALNVLKEKYGLEWKAKGEQHHPHSAGLLPNK